MIKKLFFTIAILLFGTFMFANSVTMDVAKTVATNWYKHYKQNGVTDYSISDSYETKYNGTTTFYTFLFNAGGFVMVPADDIIHPVIGYSLEGSVDRYNIPENAQAFLDDYSLEIFKNIEAGSSNAVTIDEWNKILAEQFLKSPTAVAAMCATTWDQTTPYNNLCPSGTPTGCVATGMAQIMKKWGYPTMGVGSHSYIHATYGTQTANFGATTYAWASMVNSYAVTTTAAQKTAVATLMYHCGVSINMNYAPAGSGAYNTDVPGALINYFSYQPSAEAKNRSMFPTDASWDALIKAEMDQGRPCLLAGDNAGTNGHEFVCDGYNSPVNHFHINWGWGGSLNGYFYLTALNPGSYNFSSDRQATIRIRPLSSAVPIADFIVSNTIPAIAAPVDFTDQSLNSPTSWLWTFDGGTPATSTLQNPTGITFATNGYHVITLTATNAAGSDIKTRERYIKVGGTPTVWIRQNSSFPAASRGIDEIDILDANTVWAKGYNGTNPTGYIREFTKTNNGGTTWNPGSINFTGSTNYGVSNLFEFDYLNAYACMFPLTGTGGAIVKTTDGGTTWAIQPTATFTNSWADFVHFFDANNGVAVGDPATSTTDFVIYTTSDGGTTWTQVSTGSLPNSLSGEASIVNLYTAVGNTMWFATNKGRMYKSTNKGLTWAVSTTGFPSSYNMRFKDASNGIAVSDTLPYNMKKTIDGGTTWTALAPTGFLVKRPVISYVPGTASRWFDVASYPSNGSSYSIDDCASMLNVDTGSVQFTAVSFFDVNTGWAGSFNTSPTVDGIYKWDPSVLTATNIEDQKLDDVLVYPVPSKNIVNIQLGKIEEENMSIEVYNMLGEKVISKQIKAVSKDVIQLDLSDKDAGLYFVNIHNGTKKTTKKIAIVR
ncbi:MAG: C10 family peptidase [Bacteroidetes bacterium]|nr:C10 family peptidase [Bacteroidota bacterium]